MNVEKDLLNAIDSNDVIKKLAAKSNIYRKMLF